jgi:hypothetical protein
VPALLALFRSGACAAYRALLPEAPVNPGQPEPA